MSRHTLSIYSEGVVVEFCLSSGTVIEVELRGEELRVWSVDELQVAPHSTNHLIIEKRVTDKRGR